MSTSTTRMLLTKPDVADSMATGATTLSANYDVLDSVAGAATFTSGTRPATAATRWAGRIIFESDTGNYMYWNGIAWVYWGNATKARQLIDAVNLPGTTVNTSTETILASSSYTFTATQNRRYRGVINLGLEYGTNVNDFVIIRARWAVGGSVTTGGTEIFRNDIRVNCLTTTGLGYQDAFDFNYTATTQQITVGLSVFNNSATASMGVNGSSDSVDTQGCFVLYDWSA